MKAPQHHHCILINNANIINGTGSAPYKASLLIRNKKIYKIISPEKVEESDKNGCEVIDASEMFVLPGMIDCHVHTMINQYNLTEHIGTPFSLNFYKSVDNMRSLLLAGITSARDAGGADLGIKQAQELGIITGPKLKISISPLSITGGHLDAWMPSGMRLYLLTPPYPGNPAGICDGHTEIRKRVREILRSGADVIKVCSTGGVMSPTDHPRFTQFTPAELRIIVEEAAMRKGVKVMAHAQGTEGIKNAIRAGVHSIEHGIFLDDEAIDLLLENDVFLVPTLLAIRSVIEGNHPDNIKEKAKQIFEYHQSSIHKAYKAGVKIAMGTDSGIFAHGKNLEELKLMCDVGFSPAEAITASSHMAAKCLEIDNETGTIAEGKKADILIVKENPLEDITTLQEKENIKVVLQEGEVIKNTIEQRGK